MNPDKTFKSFIIILLCFLISSFQNQVYAEPQRLEIFVLKYRTTEEILPLLRPLTEPSSLLTGMGGKIALKGTEDEIARFRVLLDTFDVAPRTFLIRVKHDIDRRKQKKEIETSARITVGNGANAEVSGKTSSYKEESTATDSQQIKVLEGTQGFIQTGQSMPMKSRTGGGQTVYRDISTGFYVLPRKAGDRVILEISPHRRTVGRHGRVESQESSTIITAVPGEWVELAASGNSASGSRTGIFSASDSSSASRYGIYIMVTEAAMNQ